MNLRVGFTLVFAVLVVAIWFNWHRLNSKLAQMAGRPSTLSKNEQPKESASGLTPIDPKRESAGPHPLDSVLKLARQELEAFTQNVFDYTAMMRKRERIGGKLSEEFRMFVKIINRRSLSNGDTVPLHAYLRFESPSSVSGREVIWVEGKNNGNLIAHEAGIFNLMSVRLPPDGSLAMMGNKYPITGIGMGNLYVKLIEKGERDRHLGDCEVTMREKERLGEREVAMIEVKHATKKRDYDFHIARIYLDLQRHLPIRYESYLWPAKSGEEPPLEEQYTYEDIELNVGLSEFDFDATNASYQFPK